MKARSIPRTLMLVALVVLQVQSISQAQRLPAFPGAEGYGKWAAGGRGGEVVAVTNLLDDPDNPPEGSFRWAVERYPDRSQALTIVFRVSGIIDLKERMTIQRSNLTIAGQTAPGDGICFRGHYFRISGGGSAGIQRNVILRYLRFRPGIDIDPGDLSKGIGALGIENCENIIVDHCSFSWANEECAIFYDNKYTTVQWCIASEGLYDAGHAKGGRSYCGVWGGQYASYHHNLIAHNRSRTIRFNGARAHDTLALVDYRNNVVYNWNNLDACYGGEVEIPGGASYANLVNNYYKAGPATPLLQRFVGVSHNRDNPVVGKWFVTGNVMEGQAELSADNWLGTSLAKISAARREEARSGAPFPVDAPLPPRSAEEAYQLVLERAGASHPRDAVDARIVEETRSGTASGTGVIGMGIIDDPAAVGGYPAYATYNVPEDLDGDGMADAWELARGLDPGERDDRNLVDSSGYTMLELYLNSLVANLSLPAAEQAHIRGLEAHYCSGMEPGLLTGQPAGGTFLPSPGLQILGGDSALFNPQSPGEYEITYLGSPGGQAVDTVVHHLVVHEPPQLAILGLDSSYMQASETIQLSGSPEGGAFLPGDGLSRPGRDESPFDLSQAGTFEVRYHYLLAPACGDTAVAHTTIEASTGWASSLPGKTWLYPNPARDRVWISTEQAPLEVRVFSSSGMLVRVLSPSPGGSLELENLDPGLYHLRIHLPGRTVSRKLLKY